MPSFLGTPRFLYILQRVQKKRDASDETAQQIFSNVPLDVLPAGHNTQARLTVTVHNSQSPTRFARIAAPCNQFVRQEGLT